MKGVMVLFLPAKKRLVRTPGAAGRVHFPLVPEAVDPGDLPLPPNRILGLVWAQPVPQPDSLSASLIALDFLVAESRPPAGAEDLDLVVGVVSHHVEGPARV